MDRRVDLAVAGAFLAFGGWLFWASGNIRQGSVPDSVGSGGVARVLATVIIIMSATLIVRRLLSWTRTTRLLAEEGSTDDERAPASSRRAFLVFAMLVAYVAGVQYVGYPIATPLFLLAGLLAMDVRSISKLTAIPIGYTVGTYVLFVGAFGVLLPLGLLQPWDYYLWFHL